MSATYGNTCACKTGQCLSLKRAATFTVHKANEASVVTRNHVNFVNQSSGIYKKIISRELLQLFCWYHMIVLSKSFQTTCYPHHSTHHVGWSTYINCRWMNIRAANSGAYVAWFHLDWIVMVIKSRQAKYIVRFYCFNHSVGVLRQIITWSSGHITGWLFPSGL